MRCLVELFKAFSDETRLRIVNLLLNGELCVCELMDALQMPQPRVSHQLRILKNAGVVIDRREGKWIIYALEPKDKADPTSALLQILRNCGGERTFERDRGRLHSSLTKGLRASCRMAPVREEEDLVGTTSRAQG